MHAKGWVVERLDRLVEVKHGFAFSSEFFCDDGVHALLTPGNFREEGGFRGLGERQRRYSGPVPNGYLLDAGEVLVAMTEQAPGLLGSALRVPSSGVFLHNQRLGLLRVIAPERISRNYLYHLFNLPQIRREISAAAGGTKVRHTSPSKLTSLAIALPDLEYQRRAATLLDAWDHAIEKTERLIVATRRRHEALSRRMALGSIRLGERPAMKKLHFFEVPVDWPVKSLGEVASEVVSVGKNADRADLPVLSCTKHAGLVESLKFFKKQVFSREREAYKIVRSGQFAYATNHLEEGSIGLLDSLEAGLVSPMYTVFEVDSAQVDRGFFYKLLKTETLRKIFASRTNASVDRRGGLRWSEFSRITIALPSLAEQERINEALNTSIREIDLLQTKLAELRRQKRGLMQKLLTGEWRLPAEPGPRHVVPSPEEA